MFSPILKKHFSSLILFILILSGVLQFAFGVFNDRANDSHLDVVSAMQGKPASDRIAPAYDECRECYHPRLFHTLMGLPCIIERSCSDNSVRSWGQLCNSIFIFTHFLLLSLIIKKNVKGRVGTLIVTALVVLNSRLIFTGAQATNDAAAITFGLFGCFFE